MDALRPGTRVVVPGYFPDGDLRGVVVDDDGGTELRRRVRDDDGLIWVAETRRMAEEA